MTLDGSRVFVANDNDTVSVINTELNLVIATISVGDKPFEVAICQFIPPTIPTLSEWSLIAMAGILGIIGFMVMRRRKVTV